MPYVGADPPPAGRSVEAGVTDGVAAGVTGPGVLIGAAGPGDGARAGAGRRPAAFLTGFFEEAFFAGFLAVAFLALVPLPDALRTAFLRLEALRFAFFLATVVPPWSCRPFAPSGNGR